MATLEEQLQNLIQEVNPMGSGVMSDQDVERVINASPSVRAVLQMMEQTLAPNTRVETRIDNLRKLEKIKNSPQFKGMLDGFREQVLGAGIMTDLDAQRVMQATSSDPTQSQFQNLIGDFRTETVGPGVMTDFDAQRVMQAFGGSNNAMPVGQGAMSNQEQDMFMQATPSSPMQPLVDLGFGEEVNIILNNPSESEISMQAQQRIINELGTGMDIDGFLMEVIKVAPDEPELDAGADGIMGLMQ